MSLGSLNLKMSKHVAKIRGVLDNMGFKKYDSVYIYSEKPDPMDQSKKIINWTKIVPTPKIITNFPMHLIPGGESTSGNITLQYIPLSYTKEFLETASLIKGEMKLYIIDGYAYTTAQIELMDFYWAVNLTRFKPIKKNTYTPPED